MEHQAVSQNLPALPGNDALAPLDGARHGIILSTFDESDPAQQVRLMRIVQDERIVTKECKDTVIEIEHIICMRAELPDDDTGELTYRQRVFMVPPNGGAVVSSTARGVLDSLRLAFHFFGPPPWRPARKFQVKAFMTDKKRETIKLLPCE